MVAGIVIGVLGTILVFVLPVCWWLLAAFDKRLRACEHWQLNEGWRKGGLDDHPA
jgi:hypothetical protein